MRDNNNLRMTLKAALDNLWSRITGKFDTVNDRVDDAVDYIDTVAQDVEGVSSQVTAVTTRVGTVETRLDTDEGRIFDLEDAVDDLDGAMIKTISLNGTNVPKDAQGNVALRETDPTVPAWAKQVKAKTSDLTNDGEDGTHPFISADDVVVPTKTSDLTNDGDGTSPFITRVDLVDQAIVSEDNIELTPYNIFYEFSHREHKDGEAIFTYISPAGMVAMLPPNSPYSGYSGCTFRGASYTKKQYMTYDDFEFVGWMDGTGIHELVSGYIHRDASANPTTTYITSIVPYSGGGGGGGFGAVDTITFNDVRHTPDANGNVSLTETDPTVPAWAKAANKPTYTAQEVGAVAKSGDTMTGNLTIRPSSGTANLFVQASNGLIMRAMVEQGGYHGLYSNGYWNGSALVSDPKWMIFRYPDGKVGVADHYNKNEVDSKIASTISSKIVDVGTITIGSNGYTAISSYIPSGIVPFMVLVQTFGYATGAINITSNGYYAFGAPGTTMTNAKLIYYYRG